MKTPRILILAALLLSACNVPTPPPTALPTPAFTPTATIEPSPTPLPERTLTVCLTEEPQTLYLYGGVSRSAWNVLDALYDGPIDTVGYAAQPVVLEKMPSLADGDAALAPVEVRAGDAVLDADGRVTALATGTRVYPSGCASASCIQTWDGTTPLQMDQASATYTLREGVQWSDGAPLRAADSVFSFQVASDPVTPVSKALLDRTVRYEALDDLSLRWTGIPGYTELRLEATYWPPLPSHLYEGKSAADLLADEGANRAPLGWGPYVLEEWVAGDHITFGKNPNYFRAGEGLPKFEYLVYRFLDYPADNALEAAAVGECDVVDRNPGFQPELAELASSDYEGRLSLLLQQGPEWEMLAFGIRPASYDDGYQPGTDRPDFFGDIRMRVAVAKCIDLQTMAAEIFNSRSSVPGGTLPPSHPFFQEDLAQRSYQPEVASQLLDEVGWRDQDGDPTSPRTALGVAGVVDGTPLQLALLTTQAALRQATASRLSADLLACGIQVNTQALDTATLYQPGPDGALFGRNFDLALFSWEAGARPGCALFTSAQVPAAGNLWTGANVTGFSNPAFDETCANALAQPGSEEAAAAAEKAFTESLPALPLYFHLHMALTRPDLCGLSLDPTARGLLWNLENLDWGANCAATAAQ